MTDDTNPKVTDLSARRAKAKAALGEPKTPTANIAAMIRALKPGDELMGKPPCGGNPPREMGTGLPPHCPVRPLGRDGDVFYFLNAAGGLGELSPSSSGKGHIDALFSGQWPYLVWAWGRVKYIKGAPHYQENYDAEKVRSALFDAATMKGSWNSVDMVRGRGAWIDPDGKLILHLGDHLLVNGHERAELGERDGFLYPGRPPVPGPSTAPQPAGPEGPGQRIMRLLNTWNWVRPDMDPHLLLGWICAAMVGGALPWRPTVFMIGDAATGKSTLQKAVGFLLGGALVQAVETTAAGIYQVLKNDCLPVAVDELEGQTDGRKVRSVIELARVANSGGRMLRGGQDHNGRQFDLRSPFLFSAINAPPLQSQDRSRMAILSLRELAKMEGGAPVDLSELAEIGRQLFRRIIDWWPRLHDLHQEIRHWLIEEAGHDGRGADTFGTLVTFYHAAMSDEMPTDEELLSWCALLKSTALAEYESRTPNWKLCLRHLLQVRPDALRQSADKTVGALLQRFVEGGSGDDVCDAPWLRHKLAEVGLGLSGPKRGKVSAANSWLFVPNDHSSLAPLFDGVKWQAEGGAPGTWTEALRQSPKWETVSPRGLHRQGNGRVGMTPLRGTLLRLDGLFDAVGDTAMDGGTKETENEELGDD
ncbi:hypothetical protein [Hyphomonas sp.]|jgi:hypothetical protein|uniref:hypothetical protein n=1 Tax=Hyphomonas sp. TaxID=87 RepID=UPI0032EB32D5